jgi:hypothetical protein
LYSEDGVRSVVEEAVTAHPQLVEARLVEAMRELAMEMGVDCDEVLSKYGDDRMKRKTDEDAQEEEEEEEEEEEDGIGGGSSAWKGYRSRVLGGIARACTSDAEEDDDGIDQYLKEKDEEAVAKR